MQIKPVGTPGDEQPNPSSQPLTPCTSPINRYRENSDLFEWYAPYEYIKDRLTAATGVNEASKVLILGCGTSGRIESNV